MKIRAFSMRKLHKYGVLGVLFYYVLSLPVIRESIVRGNRILDSFDGEVQSFDGVVQQLAQYTLVIPYILYKYVFSYFEIWGVNALVMLIMTYVVYIYFSKANCLFRFLVLLFFFIPAPILFLSIYHKETYMVLALFFAYGYSRDLTSTDKHFIFFTYALFMRFYLLWVPLVMAVKNVKRVALISSLAIACTLFFQVGRDLVLGLFNRRLHGNYEDVNSVIAQSTYATEVLDIFRILVEVLPQVIFPFLIAPSVKTLYFQMFIIGILWVGIMYKNIYSRVIMLAFFLYTILDPDLGAFLRHMSSFFLLLPLALGFTASATHVKTSVFRKSIDFSSRRFFRSSTG